MKMILKNGDQEVFTIDLSQNKNVLNVKALCEVQKLSYKSLQRNLSINKLDIGDAIQKTLLSKKSKDNRGDA